MNEVKKTTLKELAEKFEVSKRTNMRDINVISSLGVPIETQPGFQGGVLIYTFGANILSAFSNSSDVYQLGKEVLRIIFLTFPLMGIFYTIMTLYEVTGHALPFLS